MTKELLKNMFKYLPARAIPVIAGIIFIPDITWPFFLPQRAEYHRQIYK